MEIIKKINTLLQQSNTCILSSVENGYPVSRAMLTPCVVEHPVYYFHTNTSSKKVMQFQEDAHASMYLYSDLSFEGILLIGEIEVISDEHEKKAFWKDEYKMYYSQKPGIEDFTVLKFTAIKAEVYQNFQTISIAL